MVRKHIQMSRDVSGYWFHYIFSVRPVHHMVDKYGNMRRGVQLGTYYLFSQQYSRMGCSYAEFNCSWYMDSIYTSRFLNSELFGWVYKPFVTIWTLQLALMSDNTSAVAYLRYQGTRQISNLTMTYTDKPEVREYISE